MSQPHRAWNRGSDVRSNPLDNTQPIETIESSYENQLVKKLIDSIIFSGQYPDKLATFVSQDVASPQIEDSLLNAFVIGYIEVRDFVTERLTAADSVDKPSVPSNAKITKVKSLTFAILF